MNRSLLALLAVLALVLGAGCLGMVFGDGIEAVASPAEVEQDAVDDTGFEYDQADTIEIDETVEAAGQERRILITNHVRTYQQTEGAMGLDQQTGAFVVLSTPDVTVARQSVNPLTRMDHRELLGEFEDELESEVGSFEDVRKVDERTEPILGTDATVTTFAADTEMQGQTVTLHIHLTTVTHEGDVILAMGIHPEAFQHQASEVFELMNDIEHPVEE